MSLNIYQRMLKITSEAGKIPKNGYNAHGKYKYVKAADCINSISKLLVVNGVSLTISDNLESRGLVGNGKQIHSHLNCIATFVSVDNPEEKIVVPYSTVSGDISDKDVFKAKTNGLKYLFTQMFLLVTDDVRDTEEESTSSAPQPSMFDTVVGIIGDATEGFKDTERLGDILTVAGIRSSSELKTKSPIELNKVKKAVEDYLSAAK